MPQLDLSQYKLANNLDNYKLNSSATPPTNITGSTPTPGPLGGLANFIGGGKLAQGLGQTFANIGGVQDKTIQAQNQGMDIQTHLLQQIQQDKASGKDTSRLQAALQQLGGSISSEANNTTNLGTQGLSNKEVIGSSLQLAANALPGAGKSASLLEKSAIGAGTGYAYDVGNKLQSDTGKSVSGKDFIPGTGTVIGGVLPVLTKIGGYLAKNLTGFTSGSGVEAVQRALDNPNEVNTAINKYVKTPEAKQGLISQAKNAIRDFVESKQNEYGKTVNTLAQQQGSPVQLTKQPAVDAFKNALGEFGVKIGKTSEEDGATKAGKLDFTNSNLTNTDQKNIEQAYNKINNWTDTSPQGLDKLRQTLQNFMEDFKVQGNPRANVILAKAEDSLGTHLNANIPGYQDMVSNYNQKSQLTSQVLKELGFNGNAKPSTQLNTIMNLFKKSPEVRNSIIKVMGATQGDRFMNELSGAIMSSWLPQGTVFGNVLRATPEVAAGTGAALVGHAPLAGALALPAASVMSPRIVGTAATTLGKVLKTGVPGAVKKVVSALGSKIANPNK